MNGRWSFQRYQEFCVVFGISSSLYCPVTTPFFHGLLLSDYATVSQHRTLSNEPFSIGLSDGQNPKERSISMFTQGCTICLTSIPWKSCATLSCSHSFCLLCIDEWAFPKRIRRQAYKCPMCRQDATDDTCVYIPDHALDGFVDPQPANIQGYLQQATLRIRETCQQESWSGRFRKLSVGWRSTKGCMFSEARRRVCLLVCVGCIERLRKRFT